MNIMFELWGLATGIALLLLLFAPFTGSFWQHRKLAGELATGLLIAGGILIIGIEWPWPLLLALGIAQAWFTVLSLRLVIGRLDDNFLKTSTALNVSVASVVVALAALIAPLFKFSPGPLAHQTLVAILLALSVGLGLLGLWQTIWTLKHYSSRRKAASQPQGPLPTVSVCIPARNEDHALAECLTAVLASDYPKLEVIVLDDCSQDSTSQIVRSFAHDGVRFVQGEAPAAGWLGKNQAMETLAEHATGEFILFMSVDTLLSKNSISAMVDYLRTQGLQMISVLPQQRTGVASSTVLMPLQYTWQIVFPVTASRVPVSSKSWLIKAASLRSLGGFGSVRHKIVPESSFAGRLHVLDAYHFVVGDESLGISTAKRWHSQAETSLRLLYPTLKRQPMFTLLAIITILFLLTLPFVIVVLSLLLRDFAPAFWVSLLACLIFYTAYGLVLVRTHPLSWIPALLLLPIVLLQEAGLIAASMLKFEFGTVNWKGRNVCYPVIRVQSGDWRRRQHSLH